MTSPNTAELSTAAAATSTSLVGHAQALQSVLLNLSALTVSQLVSLFRQYQHLPNFAELLKAAFPEIVMQHATAAATVTAQWYDDLTPAGSFTAAPVVDLPVQRIDKTIGWALAAPGDATALDRLAGSAKRMVFDASRDTVLANAKEQGWRWARYASANACAFCRMLATKANSRRALYTSAGVQVDRESGNYVLTVVGRSGRPRGTRQLGAKYHDHCRCIAVPVPPGQTYTPPDYTQQWGQDYRAAVKATKSAGQTRGENGAIDFKAVLAHMRANTDAH